MQASKTFRVFVSSTFSDLKEERNALQQYVFPRLRELCMQHGCRFQAIDLRWGVSEEASRDQQTVKICLEEIKRCQRVTPRPNFIVLLGDRYGWRPLPAEIPEDEFKLIEPRVNDATARTLLKDWYMRDENAVPPLYCLQPRKNESEFADFNTWEAHVERPLRQALIAAIEEIGLDQISEDRRLKYGTSATEEEISTGALSIKDAPEHVFCFFRKIQNLPRERSAKDFVDLDKNYSPDPDAVAKLEGLKARLERKLPGNIHDYNADWAGVGTAGAEPIDQRCKSVMKVLSKEIAELAKGTVSQLGSEVWVRLGQLTDHALEEALTGAGESEPTEIESPITLGHLPKLCADVYLALARVILQEIARLEQVDPLQKEITDHGSFGEDRARSFIGRAAILKTILDYVAREDRHPLAVWGESGSGKSALMAKAISACGSRVADAAIVARFIGATPASSDARSLLESICRQVTRIYGGDEATIPTDYKELVKELPQRLALAKSDKPLVVFLDALDQLSDADHGRNLIWLPRELPEHVRLVVSALPGECKSALERKLPSTNLVKLEPMPSEEGSELLEVWLKEAGRTLQLPQRDEVLRKFAASGRAADVSSDSRAEGGMPLYLKLAFEEARRWKSYSPLVELEGDIPGIIRQLFERLSLDAHHGKVMVERSLGYLAAAKNGLTEDELLDVLSRDEEVLGDFKTRAKHTPPEERLPVIVWSRLYFDLEPYLTERAGDGASLLSFYHGQLGEAVSGNYLVGDARRERHRRLAAYFGEQPLQVEKDGKRIPNLRKVSELPFQQTRGEMREELEQTLCDLSFIEAKCTAVMTYELVGDYDRLGVGRAKPGPPTRTAWLWGDRYGLHCPFCLAWSEISEGQLDEVIACPACEESLRVNPFFIRAEWHVSGSAKRVVKGEGPAELRLSEAVSEFGDFVRNQAHILATHPMLTLQQAANQPDISVVAEAGKELLNRAVEKRPWLQWINKPQHHDPCIMTLTGHSAPSACAYSPDGRRIASASWDKTLKLWDAESGVEVATLVGHSDQVNACAYSPDGRRIVSASDDKTLKVWDAESGAGLATLAGHSDEVRACAYSPDGRRIVSGSIGGTLKLWDAESGEKVTTLASHSGTVNACAYSPDGRRIVSGCIDGTLKLWDAESGAELASLAGHSHEVRACTYSPDGRRIVSASDDHTIKVWDAESRAELATLAGHSDMVWACAHSPDGRRIVSASYDDTLKIWDAESGADLPTLAGHSDHLWACEYSPDGRRFVSASSDGALKIWDTESGAELITLVGHSGWVTACTYSPDGKRIASASGATLKIWDAESGAELATLAGHSNRVDACAYSPDGKRIVSVSADKTLKLWDAESGAELATLAGHSEWVNACAYSPDGRRIVSAFSAGTLKLWDAESGAELATLVGHSESVNACAYSPDGRRIVSGSGRTLDGWDSESGTGLWKSVGHLKLWDAESGVELATLAGRSEWVKACAYSPDGRRIVSVSADKTLKLWDAGSGAELATLAGHSESVNACAYSPDGRRIVSASWDKTLKLWDSQTKAELACFVASTTVTAVTVGKAGYCIGAGDRGGRVYLLRLVNLFLEPPLATPAHIYQTETRDWAARPTARCEWCGKRFTPPPIVISAIHSINKNANLSSDRTGPKGVSTRSSGRSKNITHKSASISSCAALPAEAWDDPRLLSECPSCHQPLRFNPFIVDNRERY
jgi:WD40 repeat protein